MKKKKLPAVFQEDLVALLKSLNEYEQVIEGKRFCEICSTPIYFENIQMIIPGKNNEISYICNSIECVEHYQKSE